MTITVGSVSFSQSLLSESAFFPTNSTNTIFVLQLLAALSSMAPQETFLLSCEVFRWSLVTGPEGTGLLSSIVLSRSRSFWGLILVLFSPVHRIFARFRAFALFKVLILYIAWKFRLVAEHLNEACVSSLISKCDTIPVRTNVQPGPGRIPLSILGSRSLEFCGRRHKDSCSGSSYLFAGKSISTASPMSPPST
jgi:hypothetical protein